MKVFVGSSLDLAGVTSGEVIEVFGIVASQAGQIGASLEDAEDLALSLLLHWGHLVSPFSKRDKKLVRFLEVM